jgi:uncharacterized protein YbjT (DUF2867 family)
MTTGQGRIVVVTGATGLQGGSVARQLQAQGWRVRALTRNPRSRPARDLAAQGIEVHAGDLTKLDTLGPVFAGAHGVFSVQNTLLSGVASEIQQGKNVGEAARQAGVKHLVYASAGTGLPGTGIPSWESKLVIEAHLKTLELPLTIVRPLAFMELMSEKKFYPQVSAWHLMPQMIGGDRPLPWLSVRDVGVIAAKAFAEPHTFLGQTLTLASDVVTLDECRRLYTEELGRQPPRFPMPAAIFERFGIVGQDLATMWRWLRTGVVPLETAPTLAIHPGALTVRAWLKSQRHQA